MGNIAGSESEHAMECAEWQCLKKRGDSGSRPVTGGSDRPSERQSFPPNTAHNREFDERFGVGLVFRNMRDGKMVVDSFIKDSTAYQSGDVHDGGPVPFIFLLHPAPQP